MENIAEFLNKFSKDVHFAIAKYAKEKGVTFEEACQRAYLMIDGIKVEPFDTPDMNIKEN